MFVQFLYKGELLWLKVMYVNDDNFVGPVWNYPLNYGLWFGQKIQIPIDDILDVLYKDLILHSNIMFATITTSDLDGTNDGNFLQEGQDANKTIHFGAAGNPQSVNIDVNTKDGPD